MKYSGCKIITIKEVFMDNFEALLSELIDYWEMLDYQLKAVDNSCMNMINSQLSEHELQVIVFLGKNEGVRMKDIAGHMNLGGSTLTSISDKLVEKGCVERRRSESDRRIVRLSLTDLGKKVFNVQRKMKIEFGKEMLFLLNDEEKAVFVDLMKKMAERSKKHDDKDN
jgi:DNA-binding MarR family transcriptional regulator